MKNNKLLIALVVAGVFSYPTMAEETKTVVKEETAISQVDRTVSAKEFNKVHEQVEMLKLMLQKNQLEQQISETQFAATELQNKSTESEDIKKLKAEYQAKIEGLEKTVQNLKDKNLLSESVKTKKKEIEISANPLEQIFVTQVRGIGNNLTGRFYVNNDVAYRRKGELLVDNIYVENITVNGALVRYKDKTKFLTVTTIDQAYFKVKTQPSMK